jgi:hypothetical protein
VHGLPAKGHVRHLSHFDQRIASALGLASKGFRGLHQSGQKVLFTAHPDASHDSSIGAKVARGSDKHCEPAKATSNIAPNDLIEGLPRKDL